MDDKISLRDFFEEKLNGLYKFFEERFNGQSKALELQAKKYEEKLVDLNHENKRVKDAQSEFVPTVKFDGIINQMNTKFDLNNDNLRKDIKVVNDWKLKEEGKSELIKNLPAIIAIIIAALSLLSTWLIHSK